LRSAEPDIHVKHAAPLGFAITALAVILSCACTVGRPPLTPGDIPVASTPSTEETEAARKLFEELHSDNRLDEQSDLYLLLQNTFTRLASAAHLDRTEWHLYLFDAPETADVRAVQGNYVFVWSGIFDVADDDEFAGLLACEIAHTLARHTEAVKFNTASEVFFEFADLAASFGVMILSQGIITVSGSGMTRWAYVQAADLGPLDRAYTYEEERETASVAVRILAKAGYSPVALAGLWQRVADDATLRKRAKRLNRNILPDERVGVFEDAIKEFAVEGVRKAEMAAKRSTAASPLNVSVSVGNSKSNCRLESISR
jgi:predicted Zn-dependent protease